MQNYAFIQRALDKHYRDIGHEMMVQIKQKVNAHLILLHAPSVDKKDPNAPPTNLHNPVPELNAPPQHGLILEGGDISSTSLQ